MRQLYAHINKSKALAISEFVTSDVFLKYSLKELKGEQQEIKLSLDIDTESSQAGRQAGRQGGGQ